MTPAPVTKEQLIAAALDYAARGWPVFPCSPKTKQPLLGNDRDAKGEKIKGTGGLKKASTDEAQIRAWWARWPDALIGVRTGFGRAFVIDFDPRKDEASGEEWTLERLKGELEAQMGCALPDSLVSRTQSGGVHVWLLWPDDGGPPIGNRGNLPLHVDVRGDGGYVIAPPSVMASGNRYAWLRERPIAEAPAALIEILRTPGKANNAKKDAKPSAERPATEAQGRRYAPTDDPREQVQRKWAVTAMAAQLDDLTRAREGNRGESLNRTAFTLGQLVGAGVLQRSIAVAGLEQAAADNGLAAKDGAERVRDTIERGLAAGEAQPRDMSDVGQQVGRPGGRGAPQRESGGYRDFAPFDDDDAPGPGPHDGDNSESFQTEDGEPASLWGAGGRNRVSVDADPERDRRCATLPQTDLGNAERFMVRHGRDFRFCPELGWLRWDGRRWRLLAEEKDKLPGEVMQAVFETVRAIANEADAVAESGFARLPMNKRECWHLKARLVQAGLLAVGDELDEMTGETPDPDTGEMIAPMDFVVKAKASGEVLLFSDTIRAHARASEGAGRLEAIARLVKSMAGVLVRADAFDIDREAINVRNGTIRIALRGNTPVIKLSPHRREDLITKLAEVDYDPDATCPDYDRFFAQVQPDAGDRRFLQQWAGLSATGDITHHKMAYFWGRGRNGKSTWIDAIAKILGDYAKNISFDTFLENAGNKRKGSDATPDLAQLPGVRFLYASEPEKGAKLAEGIVKEVTGGQEIQARHLNRNFFQFLPSFKFTGQGNYKLKISGTDDGIWARVQLVPWTVRIAKADIDRALPEKLMKQRNGIFRWMMEGLIDLKMNGLFESDNVREATAKYRDASDTLGRFLRDCTEDAPGKRVKSSELLALFNAWARASGQGEWQPQGFAKAMEDRGYERITSNGVWWCDIDATLDEDDIKASKFGHDEDGGGAADGGAKRPPGGTDPERTDFPDDYSD